MSLFRSLLSTMSGGGDKPLPDAYQQVDFIESNGTQYIDTGLEITSGIKADMEIAFNDSSEQYVAGAVSFDSGVQRSHLAVYSYQIQMGVDWDDMYSGISPDSNKKYHIEFQTISGNNYLKIDGTTTNSDTHYYSFPNPLNCYLFAVNGLDMNYLTKGRLYSCKLYDETETLVRDFVPCYRKSDGEVGLYDLVGKAFYTSETAYSFTAYQQVEWLRSTGTQYIDTGVYFSENTDYSIDFELTSSFTGWQQYFAGDSPSYYCPKLFMGDNINTLVVQVATAWGADESIMTLNTGQKYNLKVKGSKIYLDGVEDQVTLNRTSGTNNLSAWLFSSNGEQNLPADFKVYALKIYESNTLVRNFMPCYRVNDNVIGMYDLKGNTFYTNSGSGEFVKGNDIVTPTYTQVNYIATDDNQSVQYIDLKTGEFNLGNGSKAELKVNFTDLPANYFIFGTEDNNMQRNYLKGNSNYQVELGANMYYGEQTVGFDLNTDYVLEVDTIKPNAVAKINSTAVIDTTDNNDRPVTSYYMFTINSNVRDSEYMRGKIYYFKLWDANGNLIRDLIPVLDSLSTPCFFDRVSQKFFYNETGTDFLYG